MGFGNFVQTLKPTSRRSNHYQAMSSTRTQGQLCTATSISSFVQCQLSFRLLPSSVATFILIEIFLRYAYIIHNTHNFSGAKDSYNSLTSSEKIRITFCKGTCHWASLVFTTLTLKKTTAKVYFLQCDICIKTLCTTLCLSLH